LTNDYRKGWRYKLAHDRNQTRRRSSAIRNPVERFRRAHPLGSPGHRCASRSSTPHAGPLEVHHVGGLRSTARLVFMCRRHNRETEGMRLGSGKPKPGSSAPRSSKSRRRRSWWR